MPWKKDAAGNLAKSEAGDPVWIKEDNAEQPIPSISALNREAQTQRERADAAELKLEPFKGIDAGKAREALQTVKDLKVGDLIDKGKLDEAKAEVARQFQETIAAKDTEIGDLKTKHQQTMIESQFGASSFVKDKIATPASMFRETFKKHFTIDEKGALIAKDANGNVIYSKQGTGGPAGMDEALATLVDMHPDRASILRAPNQSGTGNQGNAGQHDTTARKIMRADFDAMPLAQQAEIGKQAAKKEVVIVNQ